jgi:hypothetical protein
MQSLIPVAPSHDKFTIFKYLQDACPVFAGYANDGTESQFFKGGDFRWAPLLIWVHKQIMGKLAANGGKLRGDIKT